MKKICYFLINVILSGLLLSACYPLQPENGSTMNAYPTFVHPIIIQSIEIFLLETFPVKAHVVVKGVLQDECIQLVDTPVEFSSQTFTLNFVTQGDLDDNDCKSKPKPFKEIIALNIEGFTAGRYMVIAQDQQTQFNLDVENKLQPELEKSAFEQNGNAMESRAVIEDLSVLVKETYHVNVSIIVAGYLPNGCVSIREVRSSREGNLFTIQVITESPEFDVACIMVLIPFAEEIPLDVEGLNAGVYLVKAGELSETFVLEAEN